MLPIDEHAKDGKCHLVSGEGWKEPTLAWWCADLPGWVDQGGMPLPMQPTHYGPMPWLMHAGAMREALETHAEWARREKAGPDYGGLTRDTHPDGERISSEWFYGNVDLCAKAEKQTTEALAATEWPKKEG